MIEILITIVVMVIGVLGLMQMQSRLQKSEVESYQRTQAMILLGDMANRLASNRQNAASYVTEGLGGQMDCTSLPSSSPVTLQETDAAQWCVALQGAAETQGGNNVGAMVGGRGCITPFGDDQYMVTVVWQGLTPISAPPDFVSCGKDQYNTPGTDCTDDKCRRYVTTLVSLARLDT